MKLDCIVFSAWLVVLSCANALAADTAAIGREAQKLHDIGKAQDTITRKCWSLLPKLDPASRDAGLVNTMSYLGDMGASWSSHVRIVTEVVHAAALAAANPGDVEPMLGALGMSLESAAKYYSLVLKVIPEGNLTAHQEVAALANEMRSTSVTALKMLGQVKGMLGQARFIPFPSAALSKAVALQDRARNLIGAAAEMRKSAKSGEDTNLAEDIFMHANYAYEELNLAAETVVYALLFPKQVKDQAVAAKARDTMVKYVNFIQRDMDKLHNRLTSYASEARTPEFRKARAELLSLATAFQSFMVDLMRVVSTGQDAPGGQASGGGQGQPRPSPQSKAGDRDASAARDRQAFEGNPPAQAKGNEQSKTEAKTGAKGGPTKWDPGALPR